ncbi:unnamed protein product (macronuclear) [Paramecium tetraurelia]|uniref:Uncharacterized protein n=1 Tax=Paramecium tetraurelia TaxID=5888 RepID=A0CM64_PARTE|nr:uncharacterized protein GSPATT00008360001 [Paramecium tetraurelia]CAK71881.1 unnamed protein product [Paramecium tetraurelia]|eukprot:XP_001439278.1 hypothetical protein (macronuclear) [Paramecium tetraurelia strain d4-2]
MVADKSFELHQCFQDVLILLYPNQLQATLLDVELASILQLRRQWLGSIILRALVCYHSCNAMIDFLIQENINTCGLKNEYKISNYGVEIVFNQIPYDCSYNESDKYVKYTGYYIFKNEGAVDDGDDQSIKYVEAYTQDFQLSIDEDWFFVLLFQCSHINVQSNGGLEYYDDNVHDGYDKRKGGVFLKHEGTCHSSQKQQWLQLKPQMILLMSRQTIIRNAF